MAGKRAEAGSFPVAPCKRCGRVTLTYARFAGNGDEQRLCVHCNEPVSGKIRQATGDEMEAAGYTIVEQAGCGGRAACHFRSLT